MSASKTAPVRKKGGRTRSRSQGGKPSSAKGPDHYTDPFTNYTSGKRQEQNLLELERKTLAAPVVFTPEEDLDETKEKRMRAKAFNDWLRNLERREEKYKGFGFLQTYSVGGNPSQITLERIPDEQTNALFVALDLENYYLAPRSDRLGETRKVKPGLVMVTITHEPSAERAIQRALRLGVISVDEFLEWHRETMSGYPDVFRRATCYKGAKAGLDVRLMISHAQQRVFHDHLWAADTHPISHERLGYIGSADRLVLNGAGLSNIGARRQKMMGFQPVPQLLFTSKEDQEKGEPAVRVVTDWQLLERRIKMRMGEFKTMEEMMKEWRTKGADPKKDPSRLSRNLGLGVPWDIHVHDYVDARVRLLRSRYPEAEPFFLAELEVQRAKNRREVREAHAAIFRQLMGLGWSREKIIREGIEPKHDPVEAERLELERQVVELTSGKALTPTKKAVEPLPAVVAMDLKESTQAPNNSARAPAVSILEKAAPAKAATPAPAAAAPAAAAAPKVPLFTAKESIKALAEANIAVSEGKDLSGLTDRQRKIVEIKPAKRIKRIPGTVEIVRDKAGHVVMEDHPFAGRVGLTAKARRSATEAKKHSEGVLTAPADQLTLDEIILHKQRVSEFGNVIKLSEESSGGLMLVKGGQERRQGALQPDQSQPREGLERHS